MFIWNWYRWTMPGSKHHLLQRVQDAALMLHGMIARCVLHFKIVQPFTTTLILDLLWSSSLQHLTRSGVKVRLDNCLVTCCHLTMKDESENTGCCYSVWSAVVFFGAGSPLPYEGGHVVLVCSGTPAPSSSGAVACLVVTSLACWLLGLLKRLAYVWKCRH